MRQVGLPRFRKMAPGEVTVKWSPNGGGVFLGDERAEEATGCRPRASLPGTAYEKRSVNSVPSPGVERTEIVPPCNRMI